MQQSPKIELDTSSSYLATAPIDVFLKVAYRICHTWSSYNIAKVY